MFVAKRNDKIFLFNLVKLQHITPKYITLEIIAIDNNFAHIDLYTRFVCHDKIQNINLCGQILLFIAYIYVFFRCLVNTNVHFFVAQLLHNNNKINYVVCQYYML